MLMRCEIISMITVCHSQTARVCASISFTIIFKLIHITTQLAIMRKLLIINVILNVIRNAR